MTRTISEHEKNEKLYTFRDASIDDIWAVENHHRSGW